MLHCTLLQILASIGEMKIKLIELMCGAQWGDLHAKTGKSNEWHQPLMVIVGISRIKILRSLVKIKGVKPSGFIWVYSLCHHRGTCVTLTTGLHCHYVSTADRRHAVTLVCFHILSSSTLLESTQGMKNRVEIGLKLGLVVFSESLQTPSEAFRGLCLKFGCKMMKCLTFPGGVVIIFNLCISFSKPIKIEGQSLRSGSCYGISMLAY